MNKGGINVSDIARELGIAPSTVSRALSGNGRVSEQTKRAVEDYIANNGGAPNVRTSKYTDKKTMNIGVCLPAEEDYAELPFFTKMLMTLYDFFSVRGYNIILLKTGQWDITALKNAVKKHVVDGIVLTRVFEYGLDIQYLKEKGVPFVVTGSCDDPEVYQIDVDQRSACRDLTNILYKMGIRKTALMSANFTQGVIQLRMNGYMDALRENDIPIERKFLIENAADINVMEKAVMDILRECMECIICTDDGICISVLNYLRELGVRVPEDIKIASFYNSSILEEQNSSITSIDFDIYEWGKLAGMMLERQLSGEEGEKKKTLGYKMLLKESTKFSL